MLEFHARCLVELCAGFAEIEKRPLREAENAGEKRRRELLNSRVVFLHRVVEEAARRGELVLDVGQVTLQLLEIRVRFQVRVALGECEQLAKCPGEHVLRDRKSTRLNSSH